MAPCGGPSSGPSVTATSAAPALAEQKARHGHVVSVCLPARDEAATVGPIVEQLRRHARGRLRPRRRGPRARRPLRPIATARDRCRRRRPRAWRSTTCSPSSGPGEGKGEALWKSVAAAEGDLIVWCDADIIDFGPHFVVGLLGPLLARPDIRFVKGFYDRPVAGSAHGGGRVTELMARPVDRRAVPPPVLDRPAAVGRVRRPPSAPRAAAVRAGLRRRPRPARRHRRPRGHGGHRPGRPRHCAATATAPLDELGPQALAVLQTALGRPGRHASRRPATLVRPDLEPVEVGDRRATAARRRVRLPPSAPRRTHRSSRFRLGRSTHGNR